MTHTGEFLQGNRSKFRRFLIPDHALYDILQKLRVLSPARCSSEAERHSGVSTLELRVYLCNILERNIFFADSKQGYRDRCLIVIVMVFQVVSAQSKEYTNFRGKRMQRNKCMPVSGGV